LDLTDIAGREALAVTTEGEPSGNVEIKVAAAPETP
jgi:hypothetical protein